MSLEEGLLEEVLKEEETPVAPCGEENSGGTDGGEGSNGGDVGIGGDSGNNGGNDEGGRPLPIIPPGGPATPDPGED